MNEETAKALDPSSRCPHGNDFKWECPHCYGALRNERDGLRARVSDLEAEIEELKRPGFVAFVALLDDFLTHYPPDSIVCSDKPDADVGAKFTHALRTARVLLPNQIKDDK